MLCLWRYFSLNKGYEIEINMEDLKEIIGKDLPNPDLVEYYRGLARREIVWNSNVDQDMCNLMVYFNKWNREDIDIPVENRVPIKFFINSDGGEADTVMFLSDIISMSKTPVYTIGMSRCFSAGGILLMCGHKRLIFKNTSCLIHDGSGGAIGDVGKVFDNLEFMKKQDERINKFITEHTKISEKLLKKNYRKDWFLNSDEMIEYGVADKIIESIDEVI